MSRTLLSVPNIAEGRDAGLVAAVAGDDALIDVHTDSDHNRSVLTYGGSPPEVVRAVRGMLRRAIALLDLSGHEGVHPRFGVVDVVPFVPYGCAFREALQAAMVVATDAARLGVPAWFYAEAAFGGLELPALRAKLRRTAGHPTAGIVCVGVRGPLVAFNVTLDTTLERARAVARSLREASVRALAFPLLSRGLVQVSMNLLRPAAVGPAEAFRRVASSGERIVDCEIVGLLPAALRGELEGLPLLRDARTIEDALRRR